jgi:hypothetical protein
MTETGHPVSYLDDAMHGVVDYAFAFKSIG